MCPKLKVHHGRSSWGTRRLGQNAESVHHAHPVLYAKALRLEDQARCTSPRRKLLPSLLRLGCLRGLGLRLILTPAGPPQMRLIGTVCLLRWVFCVWRNLGRFTVWALAGVVPGSRERWAAGCFASGLGICLSNRVGLASQPLATSPHSP